MFQKSWNRFQEFMLPLTGGISATNMDMILKDTKLVNVQLSDWDKDYGAGSIWDLLAVSLLAYNLKPKVCFEIGTGHGRTTHHLAINSQPETKIYTLDISSDEVVGSIFHNQPTAQKITQLHGNSTSFDYSQWIGTIDLVIVDGDHEYEGVIQDTNKAFELLSPSGCILWDDFAPNWKGVVKALKQHKKAKEFRRIAGTKWVYYSKSAQRTK